MTATSVSITVASLQELGYLKSETGTTIMSAAIIDDVIGIIVLTFVIGMKDPTTKPGSVVISTVLFFAFALVFGYIIYIVFKVLDKRYPHTRRIPILGFVLAFAMAYIAETYFGIADITGAYVAGIILCSIKDSEYIARKVDVSSYMLFAPVFFASIGLKTSLEDLSPSLLLFCLLFVIVALLAKIIGCGLMSRILGFNGKDSLKIGVGMMTRGEVALIVSQKGLSVGMVQSRYFSAVILLIMVSSIVTPILLSFYMEKRKLHKRPAVSSSLQCAPLSGMMKQAFMQYLSE
jgi:Kef-type K+ transport system membrane component KefB